MIVKNIFFLDYPILNPLSYNFEGLYSLSMESVKNPKICFLLQANNEAWILGKIARRLSAAISDLGQESDIVSKIDFDSGIVFWMYFNSIPEKELIRYPNIRHFALVTHVNTYSKLLKIKKLCELGVEPIFLSKYTFDLVQASISMEIPKNILRIGSDTLNHLSTKVRVSMCSNIYSDGRKNEKWILNLALILNPNHVVFRFVGCGWNEVVQELTKLGFEIEIFEQQDISEYSKTLDAISWCDLYIYTGWDEGALGCLDAYIMGKRMLISRQGFHQEFLLDENEFFNDEAEFQAKFIRFIDKYFKGYGAIQNWTWKQSGIDLVGIFSKLHEIPDRSSFYRVRPNFFVFRVLLHSISRFLHHRIWMFKSRGGS